MKTSQTLILVLVLIILLIILAFAIFPKIKRKLMHSGKIYKYKCAVGSCEIIIKNKKVMNKFCSFHAQVQKYHLFFIKNKLAISKKSLMYMSINAQLFNSDLTRYKIFSEFESKMWHFIKQPMNYFLDWDGTIGGFNCSLTSDNKKAITDLLKKGNNVTIATGRHPNELIDLIPSKINKYIIGANGGIILDKESQKIVYIKTIKKSIVQHVKKIAQENKCIFAFIDRKYINFTHFWKDEQFFHPYYKKNINYITPNLSKRLNTDIVLIGIRVIGGNSIQKIHNEIIEKYSSDVSISWIDKNAFHLTDKKVNKWSGIQELLKIQPNKNPIITFGDADNDFAMIQNAHLGIAMGNANEKIKSIATLVIGNCDKNPIYDFVKKLK